MKFVYICSPYRGDDETNIKNTVQYCKNALDLGVAAFSPHLYFAQFYENDISDQQNVGLQTGLRMLEKVDELWVMGTVHSRSMQEEIKCANEQKLPVYYVPEPLKISTYPVSADDNRLLTEMDCREESRLSHYDGEMVVLSHESLKPEFRTPRNQIWRVSHGPGSRPDFKYSDTVHLWHPADHDTLVVARREVLGIIKPEVLEQLEAYYPEFTSLDLETETQEQEELSL